MFQPCGVLQVYHDSVRVKTSKQQVGLHHHQTWLQRRAITQWREVVMERRRGRELHQVASTHHAQNHLLKVCVHVCAHVCACVHLQREVTAPSCCLVCACVERSDCG